MFEVSLSDDGHGAFRFVLLDQLDHLPGANENDLGLTFNYTATDSDGDAVKGSFTVTVDDDMPVASGQAITAIVDEDDIDTAWSEGTSPNDGNADGSLTNGSGAAVVSGSLSGIVAAGADEPVTYGLAANAIATLTALGLYSKQTALPENGLQLYYQQTSTATTVTITGYEPDQDPGFPNTGNPVFSLTINKATGAYEFQLFDELIHKAPASGADQNFDLRSGNGDATVAGIDFGSIITVTDKDGDTITLDGKFTIQVRDDVPEAEIELKNSSVTIDETPGNQNDDTSSSSVAALFSGLSNAGDDLDVTGTGAINFARSDDPVVGSDSEVGADSPALSQTFTLAIAGGNGTNSGLTTTEGAPILLYQEGNLIVGRVGNSAGKAAFAVHIDNSGHVSVAQYLSLKHDDINDHDENNDNGQNSGDDQDLNQNPNPIQQTLDGKINAIVTVTDSDGDTATDTVGIGSKIVFEDDGPSVGHNDTVALEDDDLPGGIEGGPDDNSAPIDATGILSHDFGSDGGSIAWRFNGDPAGFDYVAGDNGSLLVKQGSTTVLTVTLDSATGAYTVTQNAPIDHPNGNDENNVEFALTYRVTDRDGDYEDGTLKINVDDDSPTSAYVLKSGILLTADESDGLQNAVTTPAAPGDANDEDTAAAFPVSVSNPGSDSDMAAPVVAQSSGSFFTGSSSYGADGPGSTLFGIDVTGVSSSTGKVSSGLFTTDGKEIFLFEVNSQLVVGRYDATGGGTNATTNTDPAAFAIHIDPTTGVVSVIQYVSLKNDDGGDVDEDNDNGTAGNDALPDEPLGYNPIQQTISNVLRLTVTTTDHDGDSVTQQFNIGEKIAFEDDGPTLTLTLKEGAALVVDETNGVTANANETDPAGGNLGVATVLAAALFNQNADFGSDGAAASGSKVFALSVSAPDVASGFIDAQTDQAIVLVNNNGLIEGRVGNASGALAFTISVNASGDTTLTQLRAIEHSNTANNDELSGGMTANVLKLTETIKDGDGDTISASVDLGSVIKFEDDGPTLTLTLKDSAALVIDETDGVAANANETDPAGGNLGTATVLARRCSTRTRPSGPTALRRPVRRCLRCRCRHLMCLPASSTRRPIRRSFWSTTTGSSKAASAMRAGRWPSPFPSTLLVTRR